MRLCQCHVQPDCSWRKSRRVVGLHQATHLFAHLTLQCLHSPLSSSNGEARGKRMQCRVSTPQDTHYLLAGRHEAPSTEHLLSLCHSTRTGDTFAPVDTEHLSSVVRLAAANQVLNYKMTIQCKTVSGDDAHRIDVCHCRHPSLSLSLPHLGSNVKWQCVYK